MSKEEKRFWLLALLLNFLLFVPKYILEINTSSFFPFHSLIAAPTIYDKFKILFTRDNYDIFRISVDLVFFIVIFIIFKRKINPVWFGNFAGVYFFILLLFQIYQNAVFKIYLIQPVLYDDFYLLKLGFENLGGNVLIKTVTMVLFFGAGFYLTALAFKSLFKAIRQIRFGIYSNVAFGIIVMFLIINSIKSGLTFEPRHEFHMGFAMVGNNIKQSIEAHKIHQSANFQKLNNITGYDQFKLKEKPNIYCIFLESYGKILYQEPKLTVGYLEKLRKCDEILRKNQWFTVSGFSKSPVSGGSSWLSYSTVMFGFKIPDQGSFLSILKDTNNLKYIHLFRYFRDQGYQSFRLNSMEENDDNKIPWDNYTKLYAVDTWLRFKDFNYHGKLYGFGPSPPDQFALSYAQDFMRKDTSKPHIFFFITQNSHNPFYSPDSVVTDWHSLNKEHISDRQTSSLFRKPKLDDYQKAIDYDLDVVTTFISNSHDKNSIYIIIGDHQPPLLTSEENGFETPVHIISQDSSFTKGFLRYGFNSGLVITKMNQSIKHEAIYSMLLREIIRRYGKDPDHLPVYYANGLTP